MRLAIQAGRRMRSAMLPAICLIAPGALALAADPGTTPDNWAHIQVVTYASGLTGFFDTQTGTLYLYDSNLDQAVFVRRLSELGAPLEKIKN